MKPTKEESKSIDNKREENYLIDVLLNFQKKLITNEHKQMKYTKRVSKFYG
jgi:hypothetical protein